MGIFSRISRAANSAVLGPIWPNFELVRDIMAVLLACKNEEDQIKNEESVDKILLIIILWELSIAIETRDNPNLMQPFRYPNDASVKI